MKAITIGIGLALAAIGVSAISLCAQETRPAEPSRIFVSDVNSRSVPVTSLSGRSRRAVSDADGDSPRWGTYRSYASKGYSQMPELAKAFVHACPNLAVVTVDEEKADYLLIIDHEVERKPLRHNKSVLVNREGDVVWGDSTYKVDTAVKDACGFFQSKEESR